MSETSSRLPYTPADAARYVPGAVYDAMAQQRNILAGQCGALSAELAAARAKLSARNDDVRELEDENRSIRDVSSRWEAQYDKASVELAEARAEVERLWKLMLHLKNNPDIGKAEQRRLIVEALSTPSAPQKPEPPTQGYPCKHCHRPLGEHAPLSLCRDRRRPWQIYEADETAPPLKANSQEAREQFEKDQVPYVFPEGGDAPSKPMTHVTDMQDLDDAPGSPVPGAEHMRHVKHPPSTDLFVCVHGVASPDVCEKCAGDKAEPIKPDPGAQPSALAQVKSLLKELEQRDIEFSRERARAETWRKKASEQLHRCNATEDRARSAEAEVERLMRVAVKEEEAHRVTICQRDRAEEAADNLAYTIASQEEIGEYSNLNDPWGNAANLLQDIKAKAGRAEAAERELANLKTFTVGLSDERDRWKEAQVAVQSRAEQLEVQLAGCDVAAIGWSQKSPAKRGDYGWSQSYQSVLELRQRFDKAESELADLRREAGKVLEPFARITTLYMQDRIIDWFGVTDFNEARDLHARLTAAPQTKEDKPPYAPDPHANYVCVYCNKDVRLFDVGAVVDGYNNVCHAACRERARGNSAAPQTQEDKP